MDSRVICVLWNGLIIVEVACTNMDWNEMVGGFTDVRNRDTWNMVVVRKEKTPSGCLCVEVFPTLVDAEILLWPPTGGVRAKFVNQTATKDGKENL